PDSHPSGHPPAVEGGAHSGQRRDHGLGRDVFDRPRAAPGDAARLSSLRPRVAPPRKDDRQVTLSVSAIVATTTGHAGGAIDLPDALQSLRAQRYPREKVEVIVVVDPSQVGRWATLAPRFPEVIAVEAPPGLSYYQSKGIGLRRARGDVVTYVDA